MPTINQTPLKSILDYAREAHPGESDIELFYNAIKDQPDYLRRLKESGYAPAPSTSKDTQAPSTSKDTQAPNTSGASQAP